MRLAKYLILFILAFIAAWVLIFTFTQAPFYTRVPARIFTFNTRAFPIYAYVVAAFVSGLIVGLLATVYTFITMKTDVIRKNRMIHSLETDLESAKAGQTVREQLPAETGDETGDRTGTQNGDLKDDKPVPPDSMEPL